MKSIIITLSVFLYTNVSAEVITRTFGGFDPIPVTIIHSKKIKKTKKDYKQNRRSTSHAFEVPGRATIKTNKDYYKEHKPITIYYHHFPEYSTGWISITEAYKQPIHNERIKVKGSSGKLCFKGLPKGNYKAYGFAIWKRDRKYCTNTTYFKVR